MKQGGVDTKPIHHVCLSVSLLDSTQQQSELLKAVRAIIKGSKSTLMKLRKGYLVSICQENGVALTKTTCNKLDYAEALIKWVCQPHNFSINYLANNLVAV